MTLGAADFLAPADLRIKVVQNLVQMAQMEVSDLPEGALIQVAQYNPVPVANNFIGSLYRFTRAAPTVGALVFGVNNNLIDAAGDGFFYRMIQRGTIALAGGTANVIGVWLGSDGSPPTIGYHFNYSGVLVSPGILTLSAFTQIQFTILSSVGGDATTVQWSVHL